MSTAPEDPTSYARTILLVDDNTYWADTIGASLRRDGFAVSILYDGLAAVERLRVSPPDILITDYFLASLDGGKLCRVAKRLNHNPSIITIILTGGADRKLSRAPSAFADAVVAKNNPDVVLQDLQRVLNQLAQSAPPTEPSA